MLNAVLKKRLNPFAIIYIILVSTALFAAHLAQYIAPADFWPIAFAGLLHPTLTLLTLIAFIYSSIKRSLIAVIPLVALVLGINTVLNYVGVVNPFSSKTNVTKGSDPRVMTWNVHHFQPIEGNARKKISLMLRLIDRVQPDIFCVQEYYNYTNAHINLDDSIKKILHTDQYFFKHIKNTYNGMVIFSKYPILNTGYIEISGKGNGNQCIFIDVKKGQKIFRVYNVHLRSNDLPQQNGPISGPGGAIQKFKMIVSKLKAGYIDRGRQVKRLKPFLNSSPYPFILTGDFNDTPASFATAYLSKGLKNSFREKGRGIVRTYCGNYPAMQIDHIFTDPTYDVLDYNVIEEKLSDHYPVYVDIRIR